MPGKVALPCPKSTRITALGAVLAALCWIGSSGAQDSRSVPAELLSTLSLPGLDQKILRPTAIHVDRTSGELLVADSGNNRILIFGEDGVLRFSFGGGDDFATPFGVVTDSQGFIYVLGTTPRGRAVRRFDFDGTLPVELDLDGLDGEGVHLRSIAMDDADRLYVVDSGHASIHVYTRDGLALHAMQIELEDPAQSLGSITISDRRIYVPVAATGSVWVYDLQGNPLRRIGHHGSNVGELNFPVAVSVRDDGLVLVLDKHRFNVLCFGLQGKFLGEFGGKGFRPGWFYHPTLLAVDGLGQAYVGQILDNKIDVCRVPDFISRALRSVTTEPAADARANVPPNEPAALDERRDDID